MKRFVSLCLVSVLIAVLCCSCFSENKKKDNDQKREKFDIEELKENDGLMFRAVNSNWDLVNMEENYWSDTEYKVGYNGTLEIVSHFNLSGSSSYITNLSDKDYKTIYDFAFNAYDTKEFKDYKEDGCDGEAWSFYYVDKDEEETLLYTGYAYANSKMLDIQSVLKSYMPEVEIDNSVDPDTIVFMGSLTAVDQDNYLIGYSYQIAANKEITFRELYSDDTCKQLCSGLLTDSEYEQIIAFSEDARENDTYGDYSEEGDDGDKWRFVYYGLDGSDLPFKIYYGYCYEQEDMLEIIDILYKYGEITWRQSE